MTSDRNSRREALRPSARPLFGQQAAIAIAATCGLTIAATSQATLPIFAGPGGPDVPTGLRNPDADLIEGVNNQGVTLGQATSYVNGVNTGTHGYRWDTIGSPVTRFDGISASTLGSRVNAINSNGVVIGSAPAANGDQRPVVYGPNSFTPSAMATPAFSSTNHSVAYAYLLNDNNVVAGQELLTAGPKDLGTRAIRWDVTNGGITELGVINTSSAGVTNSQASSMNANNTIAGTANKWNSTGTIDLGPRGMRWAAGNTNGFELDTPFTRNDGYANVAISNVNLGGTVVGTVEKWAGSNSQGPRPVRWASGGTTATVLDVLGGDVNGVAQCSVFGQNDAGTTVGIVQKFSASNVSLGNRAVRWNAGGTAVTELAELPGQSTQPYHFSAAYRINKMGTIIGHSSSGPSGEGHATIWPAAGGGATAIDLNSLLSPKSGWLLYEGYTITDTGFVVGEGDYDPDGAGPAASYERSYTMLVPQAGTYGQGDANFDTKVDFNDLVILAQHYGTANASLDIHVADLDLNGAIDFNDLVVLAQHYGTSPALATGLGNASFQADWALAQSLVPEPSSLGALAIGIALSRRRKA